MLKRRRSRMLRRSSRGGILKRRNMLFGRRRRMGLFHHFGCRVARIFMRSMRGWVGRNDVGREDRRAIGVVVDGLVVRVLGLCCAVGEHSRHGRHGVVGEAVEEGGDARLAHGVGGGEREIPRLGRGNIEDGGLHRLFLRETAVGDTVGASDQVVLGGSDGEGGAVHAPEYGAMPEQLLQALHLHGDGVFASRD